MSDELGPVMDESEIINKPTTMGSEVKNGVGYSMYAVASVALLVMLLAHNWSQSSWSVAELGIISTYLVPLVNGIYIVIKKLLDKFLV